MFHISRNIAKLIVRNSRVISTTTPLREPRSLVRLKSLQAAFQVEDGVPIFLKAGFTDRLLYSTTLVLATIGVINVVLVLYSHARPNSWKTSDVC